MAKAAMGLVVASACGLSFVACGGEGESALELEKVTSALESTGMPTGAVCGLAYRRPGSAVYGNNSCEGSKTLDPFPSNGHCIGENFPPPTISGYVEAADGDRGLPSCNGFYHWRFNNVGTTDPRMYRLPRGTACGFKEACNNRGETCMGLDANVSCPMGWLKKVSSDLHAPSGCGFVWCEYQDPNNLCLEEPCIRMNQPVGHVCGITDNDRNNGQCLGVSTIFGCPAGYQRYGYFDDGRSAGHGVGWCARL